ncbi:MAG: archaeosortase H N-terminal-like domain-containing protein [Promethearchaeota archaeon]
MNRIFQYKILIGTISSIMLLMGFFIGLIYWIMNMTIANIVSLIVISVIIIVNYSLLKFLNFNKTPVPIKYRLEISLYLALNLLFAYFIGFTIPILQTESRNNLGGVMIPLLVILNYIIVDRYYYYTKHINERRD